MIFRQLFDRETSTYTYLLGDPSTRNALLIDPVLGQVERDLGLIDELGLELVYTLDTHAHADHVTAASALRERVGSKSVLGAKAGAACADHPVGTGDRISIGAITLEVRETPGHTNGCVSYILEDHSMAFTGDALLIRGCGRTDFQEGDAKVLYRSIHEQLFTLPDACVVYPGHDYRGHQQSTVGEEKAFNPRLGAGRTEAEFEAIMDGLGLAPPKHIDEAVPANLQCGRVAQEPVAARADEAVLAEAKRGDEGVREVEATWAAGVAEHVRVVDVREPGELAEVPMIPHARNVPLGDLGRVATAWDPSAPVVLICRSGRRSAEGAKVLEELGFSNVASARGGMSAIDAAASSCG